MERWDASTITDELGISGCKSNHTFCKIVIPFVVGERLVVLKCKFNSMDKSHKYSRHPDKVYRAQINEFVLNI